MTMTFLGIFHDLTALHAPKSTGGLGGGERGERKAGAPAPRSVGVAGVYAADWGHEMSTPGGIPLSGELPRRCLLYLLRRRLHPMSAKAMRPAPRREIVPGSGATRNPRISHR